MGRVFVLVAVMMFLGGCSTFGNVRTSGVFPDGQKFEVSSKSDALVEVSRGDVKIKIDNRGRANLFEAIVAGQLSKPIVSVGGGK